MAKKQKFDGVIEAVHYNEDGKVKWVRAYERRGPTFSDWLLIPREKLIELIKSGKIYVVGDRVTYLASTFDVGKQVQVQEVRGNDVLVVGTDSTSEQDHLEDVPII